MTRGLWAFIALYVAIVLALLAWAGVLSIIALEADIACAERGQVAVEMVWRPTVHGIFGEGAYVCVEIASVP